MGFGFGFESGIGMEMGTKTEWGVKSGSGNIIRERERIREHVPGAGLHPGTCSESGIGSGIGSGTCSDGIGVREHIFWIGSGSEIFY
ncbi:hypothetical protein NE237_014299 [Protea cynaroides]|uniref:Uncharacterized protein n=1 Tax=Protea cynaroides TaxID=273540 RepID=A0A9Q0JTQ1_9MAGN|nr:hypothetical protein NE237_014299 [Protea cynaroides]